MAPPSKPSLLKLVCTTTSIRNVTIATESDDFYYEVVTPEWDPLNTKVRKLDSDSGQMTLIAELKREEKDLHYTGLRFTNPEKIETEFRPLEEFLSTDNTDVKALGVFTGENAVRYRWRETKRSVELVQANEAEGKTLARFQKHHRHLGVLRMSDKPFLEVDAELAGSMNAFIVSFLIAEGKRRRGT